MRAMKRVTLLAALALCLFAAKVSTAHATEVGTSRTFGLGVQLFDPTAFVGKAFLDRNDALAFGIGFWGYGRCVDRDGNVYYCGNSYHYFSFHFDYLYEENIVDSVVRLDWHAGVGGRLAYWRHANYADRSAGLFARVPLGLDLAFRRPRWLEVYLEIAPGLWVYPGVDFDIDVGLGARAYF
jgi:hypothetical protein